MNDIAFLQLQIAELTESLDTAGDDPILAPQLTERLADVQAEFDRLKGERGSLLSPPPPLPRAAFFLVGGPDVSGSDGVRPDLAGNALIQYERMFVEQAIHDERQAARAAGRQRRVRNAPAPALLLTGTPRGSFGFEFVPRVPAEGANGDLHVRSLKQVADWLFSLAGGDPDRMAEQFGRVPSRVRPSLRGFLRTLADHGAGLRLAFSDAPARRLTGEQVRLAADRLEHEVSLDDVEMVGVLTGVLPENGEFEFHPDDAPTIKGDITDAASQDDIEQMQDVRGQRCTARFQKTTVRLIGGSDATTYVLLAIPTLLGDAPAVTPPTIGEPSRLLHLD